MRCVVSSSWVDTRRSSAKTGWGASLGRVRGEARLKTYWSVSKAHAVVNTTAQVDNNESEARFIARRVGTAVYSVSDCKWQMGV